MPLSINSVKAAIDAIPEEAAEKSAEKKTSSEKESADDASIKDEL